jgi:hypothetical protein
MAQKKGVNVAAAILGISVMIILIGVIAFTLGKSKGARYRARELYKLEKTLGLKDIEEKDFNPGFDEETYENMVAAAVDVKLDDDNFDSLGMFSQSLKKIHVAMLNYATEALVLNEEEGRKVLEQYEGLHERLAIDYYKELRERKKELKNKKREILVDRNSEPFITYNTYESTHEFAKVISSHICNLAGLSIATADSTMPGGFGKPVGIFLGPICKYILSRALKVVENKLREWAIIKDYTISREELKSHIREMIVHLGTAQDTFETTFDETYVRTILFFFESTANLEMVSKSVVTAGFRLNGYFDLSFNHEEKKIILTLPPPVILSVDSDTRMTNMENGWFVEISADNINTAYYSVKEEARYRSLETGLLKKAKENSKLILRTLFEPFLTFTEYQYTFDIEYDSRLGTGSARVETNNLD